MKIKARESGMKIKAVGNVVKDGALYCIKVRASDGSLVEVQVEALLDNVIEIGGKEYKVGEFYPLDGASVLTAIENDSHASAAVYAAADRAAYWKEYWKKYWVKREIG